MIPYETQPTVPLIGKFALRSMKEQFNKAREDVKIDEKPENSDEETKTQRQEIKLHYEEFERGLAVSKALGNDEDRYYKDQTNIPGEIPDVIGEREVL